MNLRQFTRLFVFAAITAAGCVSEQETVREVPYVVDREVPVYVDRPVEGDTFQGLEVIPGNLADVVVMNGEDRELIRFTVRNHGERDVELQQLPVGIRFDEGIPVEFPFSFTDLKFEDQGRGATLMGPVIFDPRVGGNVYFTDAVLIPAGESQAFVLRADLELLYGRYRVTVGALAGLLEDVVYTDTHERVPADQIRNNQLIGRVVEALELPTPTPEDDGPVALVASFGGIEGIITPSPSPYLLGTITVTAYGGDAIGGLLRLTGHLLAFSSLEVVEGDTEESIAVTSVVDSTTVDIDLSSVAFAEGELRTFQVRGILRPAEELLPYYAMDIGFLLDHLTFTWGEDESGGAFIRTFSDPRLRIFRAYPNIVAQTLPTTTLASGNTMDLYKVEISTNPAGNPIVLGGMTFSVNVVGSTLLSLSQFRVGRGSSELPRDSYRIIDLSSGVDLEEGTMSWGAFGITVVAVLFDAAPLEIGEAGGDILTLKARVDNVQPDQELRVGFGPRDFSRARALLNAEGYLQWYEDTNVLRQQDAIYWSEDPAPAYYYTGSWQITGLDTVVTLSR